MSHDRKYTFYAEGVSVNRKWHSDHINMWDYGLDTIKGFTKITITDNDTKGSMVLARRASGITMQTLVNNFDVITSRRKPKTLETEKV